MNLTFQTECGEDRWIYENLPLPMPSLSFYLDVGCGHPLGQSQTAFLRELGWHGLAIDANDRYRACWAEAGRSDCFMTAVVSDQAEGTFKFLDNTAMSRFDPNGQPVYCQRLEDILAERKIERIDFLSIDIEGHEFDALKGFNFGRWPIPIIVADAAPFGTSTLH